MKPNTIAKAQAAVAQWEALKAKAGTKHDSDLLAHIKWKAWDTVKQVDNAWAFLYEAGKFKADDDLKLKAQVGTSPDYVQVDDVTGKVLGTATVVRSDTDDKAKSSLDPGKLARAAKLRAALHRRVTPARTSRTAPTRRRNPSWGAAALSRMSAFSTHGLATVLTGC